MREFDPRTIGIVGAGTIGASWAACYAAAGLAVKIADDSLDAAERGVVQARSHLRRLVELKLLSMPAGADAASRLAVAPELAALTDGVEFIHESVPETYEAKLPLFARLDELTGPEVVLASASSGLLISRIQADLKHPGRTLIAHPFNPPHLLPLVELVGGPLTDESTVQGVKAFYQRLGKTPVVLRKEVLGHLANRLAAALWREAIDLVASGVASVEDVDLALCAGPGLRYAVMGQHLIYHLGGGEGGYRHFLEHIGSAFEAYYPTMPTWTEIPADAKEAVIAGVDDEADGRSLADLAEERDRKLAAILRALREAG